MTWAHGRLVRWNREEHELCCPLSSGLCARMIIQCCYCQECVSVVLQLVNFNLVSPSRLILVSACKKCWNCSSIYSTRGCQHLKGYHHFVLSPRQSDVSEESSVKKTAVLRIITELSSLWVVDLVPKARQVENIEVELDLEGIIKTKVEVWTTEIFTSPSSILTRWLWTPPPEIIRWK